MVKTLLSNTSVISKIQNPSRYIYKEKKNFLMCSEYSAVIFGKYTKHTATGATTCVNMYSRSDSKFPARTSM